MRPTQLKPPPDGQHLYVGVVDLILRQIEAGTLRPGDRLPSLRKLASQLEMSVPTVRQAYLELERCGRIEARPKSGYFVKASEPKPLSRRARTIREPVTVSGRALLDMVYDGMHRPDAAPIGVANPTMALPATKTLNRAMKRVMSSSEDRVFGYAPTAGEPALRRQIAQRYLHMGVAVEADDIIVTNGAQEALALALQAVAQPGGIIAVESPTYHGQLELIESLGMLALEIDTCPRDGIDLEAVERAFEAHPVAACMFSSAFNNPLGSRVPDASVEALVRLVEAHQVPLIEDDVYGELGYEGPRPVPAQRYGRRGLVLTCSSFSKTVAPGYRIGWIVPGRFRDEIGQRKRAFSCGSGLLQQLTLAEFLKSGDFDRYLRRLVPVLRDNARRMASAVREVFPDRTRVSQPQGGSVLWVEVPGLDAVELFHAALERGVSIVPGTVFAARNRYRCFIRLSYGHPWGPTVERSLSVLGDLIRQRIR